MFNFMKLERRIKIKGFDKILYSTTGDRLLCNWEQELSRTTCYVAGSRSRSRYPRRPRRRPVEYKSGSWYIENQFKFISLCVLKYDNVWYEVIWFVSIDLIENWVETSHGDLMMIFSILISGESLDDDIGFQGIWPLFNVYETDVERIWNHRRTLDTGRTK